MNSKLDLFKSGLCKLNQRFGSWWAVVLVVLALLPSTASAQISGDTKARRLLQEGRTDEALTVIDKELRRQPRDGQLLLLKGAALSSIERKSEAIKVFRQMVAEKIEEASAYNNLAVIYASRGDFEAARSALEWAIRSKPDYGTAHHNLGNVYANLASQAYKQALYLDRSDRVLPAKLSRLSEVLGQVPEASAESKPPSTEREDALTHATPPANNNPTSNPRLSLARRDEPWRQNGN
jgi:tetratricopeptide (TPR) repeat protein